MKNDLKYSALPKWIAPDNETVNRDAKSPHENYLFGLQEAMLYKLPAVKIDPMHHIYNFFGSSHFVSELKNAYETLQSSEHFKSEIKFKRVSNKKMLWDEYLFWSGAPLQSIAYKVGNRVVSGLHAICLITGDWQPHMDFCEWFENEWLPSANADALIYHQTTRAITRTAPTAFLLLPYMDSIRNKLINLNNEIRSKHPELCARLSKVTHEDFKYAVN